jgi:hypothetical protein
VLRYLAVCVPEVDAERRAGPERTTSRWLKWQGGGTLGDMEFETLANQHKDQVYRHMTRACGNREDTEDVLVEAMVKAHRHLGQLRDARAFRAWLAQIARRVCWQ